MQPGLVVAHQQRTAFAAHHVLRFMERQRAEPTPPAERAAAIGGVHAVGGVFDDEQPVARGDGSSASRSHAMPA